MIKNTPPIEIKIRNVYGEDRIYFKDKTISDLYTKLTGQVTLTSIKMKALEAFG